MTNHFGGLDVAPGCHCRVQWTWCHCWVPLYRGRVTTNFGGVDVVPFLGAIAGFHCSVLWLGGDFFSTLITQKLVFAIWGLCWHFF